MDRQSRTQAPEAATPTPYATTMRLRAHALDVLCKAPGVGPRAEARA